MGTPLNDVIDDRRRGRGLGTLRRVTRTGMVTLVCCAVPVALSACGSGESGSGTVADQARTAVEGAKTQTTEAAAATKTVTAPAKTKTVEKTVTESAPATSNSVTVQAAPSTTGTSKSDDGGLEWWAWALIGLAAACLVAAAFAAGRHGRSPPGDPAANPTPAPKPESPPGTPPV